MSWEMCEFMADRHRLNFILFIILFTWVIGLHYLRPIAALSTLGACDLALETPRRSCAPGLWNWSFRTSSITLLLWFQYQSSYLNVKINTYLTLHSAPRILPSPYILAANLHEVRTAHDCEGDVWVHGSVQLGHRLVVFWELVDGHSVGWQLRDDLRLECQIGNILGILKIMFVLIYEWTV